MMNRLLLFFLLLCCVSPAVAQSTADDTLSYTLPRLTVTATRTAVAPAEAPVRVTVIDSLAVQQTGVSSVSELLSRRGGSFVKSYGSTGISSLSLRGTGSSHSLVLLDGRRIQDPQLGQLDLSLLPTLLVESVDVMHGSGSALYGSNPFGGVINIHTLNPHRRETVRARGTFGAFGERGASMLVGGSEGRFTAVAAGEMTTTEGNFPYRNESLFPPRTVRRENADRRQLSLYSTLGYQGSSSRLRLNGWYNEADRGLPGVSTSDPQGERLQDEQLRIWGDGRFSRSWGTLKIGGLAQSMNRRYLNPEQSLDQTGRTLVTSTEVSATSIISNRWLMSGGFFLSHEQADHPHLAERTAEQVLAAFFHGSGHYGRLLLYPVLRVDSYFLASRDDGPSVAATPQLGVNVRPFQDHDIRIKSSIGRSFRMPTLNDRYWLPGGNPDLQAENGWSVDAGIAVPWTHQLFEFTVFRTTVNNQIEWKPTNSGEWSPFNVDRMLSRGIEASYRMRWPLASSSITLNSGLFYTFTDAQNRSDRSSASYNQQLRYVPRHQVKTTLGLTWRGIYFGGHVRGVSRRYVTADGRQSLPPYLVVDGIARTTFDIGSMSANFGISAENIFDEDYSVVQYYPMPPRHARIRLSLEWNNPN